MKLKELYPDVISEDTEYEYKATINSAKPIKVLKSESLVRYREEIRAYPKEAIREALVNAIAHRDYSISGTQIDVDIYIDRIDIVSPGS